MPTSARAAGRAMALTAALVVAGGAAAVSADELQAGISLYQQGKYAEAEGHLRKASGAEAEAYLAASLARQKKFAESEAAAKAVLKDGTHEMAVAALGEALVGQKKNDEAVERMTAAIKAKVDLPYAYYWRGQAYYSKKQPDRMVGDFETFLKLAPKAPEAPTIQQLLAGLR
ncbi:MAG TPA: tetratricopeptide repeat protein [Vicinamibacteria bacterium]|nr:tetratricopeptide repeat protein [Vicinamibacteria bacterium]